MREEFIFSNKDAFKVIKNSKEGVFNFQNLYSVWLFKNEEIFREEITKKINTTFSDGKILSLFLRTRQQRGPSFTKDFLISDSAKTRKHFFIGSTKPKELSGKIKIQKKNLQVYNPSFINKLEFSDEEKKKILTKLKRFSPDYVWVCIGNPKQEILSNQLFEEYKTNYLNVGAALDFLLGKKKESPKFFRALGLEWFYRLITDFKYSKKKVWRSFVGLFYLLTRQVKIGVKK
jgi:exopolysaccharide biosynthesis WecB/TagA/CpsF family protein